MPTKEKNDSEKIQRVQIDISLRSLFLILAFIAGTAFVFSIRNVLFMLFWSFILSSALLPAINRLARFKRISKGLSVAIVYISLLIITVGLFTAVSVPLAKETVRFVEKLPDILDEIISALNSFGYNIGLNNPIIRPNQLETTLDQLSQNLADNFSSLISAGASGISGVFKFLGQIFGGVFNVLLVLTMSIYISVDHDNFLYALLRAIPNHKTRNDIERFIHEVESKLGSWISGQVTSSLIVGTMTWFMLTILGVQYVWPLAILAVLLNSIPTIGATMAAFPAVIVALASGNILQIIGVPLGYIIIQQIENNYLAPKIMAKALGLPPIIIIIAVLVGAQMGGILGILFAIPLSGVIHLTIEFWINKNHN